ncbi:MAG TPA: 30S ribosomal protein S16 [Candidatus Saccharimonadales bacterium]|nr:30S ribosomal protein S16 [Candidatus Saccharimonadales bacterium]
MLAIRLQRTGRKGHAMFRMVVQDSRRTPTSGKIVASLGTYDPHTKAVVLDNEKAALYLTNGAQPSTRATQLLKSEGVKLPKWVTEAGKKQGVIRHTEKLRRNRPEEAQPQEVTAAKAAAEEAVSATDAAADATVETAVDASAETPTAEA